MLLYAGISLLCFVALLIAWRWAKRGKRIDRHPICRKCGYDMFGRDLAELPDCPECGTQIYASKHLKLGNRKPRAVTSWTAFSLALLALIASIGFTTKWAQTYEWNRIKPVAMLIREASDTKKSTKADEALNEIERRLDKDLLSNKQIVQVIDASLDHQADLSKPWDSRWGDFIIYARSIGITTNKQWYEYLSRVTDFKLIVPPVIHEGDRISISWELTALPHRAAAFPYYKHIHAEGAEYLFTEIDNQQQRMIKAKIERYFGGGTLFFYPHFDPEVALEPGYYEIQVSGEFFIPDPIVRDGWSIVEFKVSAPFKVNPKHLPDQPPQEAIDETTGEQKTISK